MGSKAPCARCQFLWATQCAQSSLAVGRDLILMRQHHGQTTRPRLALPALPAAA
jgi:hypothetical protein